MGKPVNVAISERWEPEVQVTPAKADLRSDSVDDILIQRDRVRRAHPPIEYEARGLQLFNLGMVPASVTPPRTWRWAMWFTVSSSTVVFVALGVASLHLSSPLDINAMDARATAPPGQIINEPTLLELNTQNSTVTYLAQAEFDVSAPNPKIASSKIGSPHLAENFAKSVGGAGKPGISSSQNHPTSPANTVLSTTDHAAAAGSETSTYAASQPEVKPTNRPTLTNFATGNPPGNNSDLDNVTTLLGNVDPSASAAVIEALGSLNNAPPTKLTHQSNIPNG